ncbi:MAG: hypothetical protein JNJ95_10195 [Dechloromonas sp.]|nr:hypothetical protein [Dechloromonas sp.]
MNVSAAVAALAGCDPAAQQLPDKWFGAGGKQAKIFARICQQAASIKVICIRPLQRRTWPLRLQEAKTARRAGFERTAYAAAVARLTLCRFERRVVVEVDYFFLHVTLMNHVLRK